MKRQWGMSSFVLVIGLALVMPAACDKKKDEDETEETKDKTDETEPETEAEPEDSASAEPEDEDEKPPPVKTAKPRPVGACSAQGQCSGGLCCSDGSKTFCAEKNKPCAQLVCSRDSQCRSRDACVASSIPGVKTCQRKGAAAAPKPKPKPKPAGGDVAPFRPRKK